MGDPKWELAVRITVVGHASPRWKGARTAAKADRLNQRLSERRAQNVRKVVESIIKEKLPALKIEVPSKGVGSHDGFPTAGEDNAAIDRSVVVMVELTTTRPDYKYQPRPPMRIPTPSKIWTLRVMDMVRAAGLGYVQIFLRVVLENPWSGKAITLSGWLYGGGASTSVKDSFKLGKQNPAKIGKQIGHGVSFWTKEAMLFDEFDNQWARLGKFEAKFGLTTSMTFLTFPFLHTDPDLLVFDAKPWGIGFIGADAFLVAGKLTIEGTNPGDWLELPSTPDVIPTTTTRANNDGLILSFPTEKAGLHDLTNDDRRRLREFVTNKALSIAALAENFDVAPAGP